MGSSNELVKRLGQTQGLSNQIVLNLVPKRFDNTHHM